MTRLIDGEFIVVVILYAFMFLVSVYETWRWKYRHLDYPNGFPAKTGLATDVDLGWALVFAGFFTLTAIIMWLNGEPGEICWLIAAGILWLIQAFLITRYRMTYDEYWKLLDAHKEDLNI